MEATTNNKGLIVMELFNILSLMAFVVVMIYSAINKSNSIIKTSYEKFEVLK